MVFISQIKEIEVIVFFCFFLRFSCEIIEPILCLGFLGFSFSFLLLVEVAKKTIIKVNLLSGVIWLFFRCYVDSDLFSLFQTKIHLLLKLFIEGIWVIV